MDFVRRTKGRWALRMDGCMAIRMRFTVGIVLVGAMALFAACASATPTPTPTGTITPTATPTATAVATPTLALTATPTIADSTSTPAPTVAPTPTQVPAPTATSTPSPTPTATPVPCIPSGDGSAIQDALVGEGAHAMLCAGAVFELSEEVGFTADGQEISTEGLPTDESRALLRVVGKTLSTAVHGNGNSGITLRNVIIDGNRPALGIGVGGLIEFGGVTTGQLVEYVKAYEPRGWSVLVINEGHEQLCRGVTAQFNELGPAGYSEYVIADGISLACRDSVITDNLIVDATDGGIVIFQAPGSLVANNVIRSETRVVFYGIAMGDFGPFDGDFRGTRVIGNTLDASGALMRHGINMGPAVGCVPEHELTETNYGAVVSDNVLMGTHMGYGFPVSGVRDWTVTGNIDNSTVEPLETVADECFGEPVARPSAFLRRGIASEGTFQDEYVLGELAFPTEWWPRDGVVDVACAEELVGAATLKSIRDGELGELWLAIEEAEGGGRIAQCFSIYDVPAKPSIAPHVQMSAAKCAPSCVTVELFNISETLTADMTNAALLLDSFEVECVGLPATIAPTQVVTCTIEDYVTPGFQVVNWYGFAFFGQSGWGLPG
jgi:hypothetical protein